MEWCRVLLDRRNLASFLIWEIRVSLLYYYWSALIVDCRKDLFESFVNCNEGAVSVELQGV